MDELYDEFVRGGMPNRVHLSTSVLRDQLRRPGRHRDHRPAHQTAEDQPRPGGQRLRAPGGGRALPVAAIRPALVNGKPRSKSTRRNASAAAPAIRPRARPCRSTTRSIPSWRSGWAARTPTPARQADLHEDGRLRPAQQPAALARGVGDRQEDPLPTREDAVPWERVSDWVERIGWPRFFEKCDLPFTKYLIDDWRGSRANLNASAHIRSERRDDRDEVRHPRQRRALHHRRATAGLPVLPGRHRPGHGSTAFFYHDGVNNATR